MIIKKVCVLKQALHTYFKLNTTQEAREEQRLIIIISQSHKRKSPLGQSSMLKSSV